MGSCEIPVMITRNDVVAPLNSQQKNERLALSNLDYIYNDNLMVSVYFCYANPNQTGDLADPVRVLRESLARTLSSFPVFAGEIVPNSTGEPESLLSGHGVDFLHASTELELRDLDLFHPDVSVKDTLVPNIQDGVLAVQVTEFRCGGLVVGLTFDHRVADAYSANMFIVSWAENAVHGRCVTYSPNVNRWLLRPNPTELASSTTGVERWYVARPPASVPNGYNHQPALDDPADRFTSRTFYIEAQHINDLQQRACSKDAAKHKFRSKYEAFTAFLWQVLSNSVSNSATSFKMSIAVDGRTRLYDTAAAAASLMPHYFGNVVSFPFTEATAAALQRMALSEAADLVHHCKEETATAAHFSGLVEWVEKRRPMKPRGRVYGEATREGAAVMVSSGQRFPVGRVDFGWGRPVFGSYYFPWEGEAGYVMPMPSAAREGDWVVYMHLRKKQMDVVEKEASHFFKPLVPSYFNLPS
ncbi:hypothetical protein V2J09_004122 [Rumex salicifolius]